MSGFANSCNKQTYNNLKGECFVYMAKEHVNLIFMVITVSYKAFLI